MTHLTDLSMTEALAGLARRDFSAVDLTEAYLAAMDRGRGLNAYITETPAVARAQAQASDARRAAGTAGPMDGAPLAVKDLFCTKGIRTTAASKILGDFTPPYESTVTEKLFGAGGVLLGKTNLDEFAMGSSNTASAFGPVISPWSGKDPARANRPLVPGGSSGGSAAAVAGRLALAATGTDTGGSIRQPASFSGIVGIKPTYGRCSRWGVVAFASSLEQPGPLTRTVADSALMLRAMAGFDPKDSTSVEREVPDYTAALGRSVKGLRIGIPREYRIEGLPAPIEAGWRRSEEILRAAGADIVEVSLPHTRYALPVYYIIAPAEASSNLARYDGARYGWRASNPATLNDMYATTRGQGFGKEVRRRILIGTYVLSAGYYDAYYVKAQKVRRLLRQDFEAAFTQCDALLTPTAPSTAFAIGEQESDPVQMYMNDVFTVTLNLVGLPGISVPVGLAPDGLPFGMQLMGRAFDESTLFTLASVLEKEAGFTAHSPFTA